MDGNIDIAPPMVVFQYERIPQDIFDNTCLLGVLERVKMVGYRGILWIYNEHISPLAHPRDNTSTCLDGHVSYLGLRTSTFCEKNGIILVALYLNAMHFIQPMDVAIFWTLKDAWNAEVHMWRQNEESFGKEFKKRNFAPLLQKGINRVVIKHVINNGFKKVGLYLYSASAIHFKLVKSCQPKMDLIGNDDNELTDISARETEDKNEVVLEALKV